MSITCNLKKKQRCFGGSVEFYTHNSDATRTEMAFSLFRPEGVESMKKTGPALVWLSGLTCTEENFISKAGVFPWANEYGITVICPDTSPRGLDIPGEHESWDFGSGAGFYLNAVTREWRTNYNMYDYIVQEIPEILTGNFMVDARKISISGHSMGGHGALTIALKNRDLFQSASAFSPVVAPTTCPWGIKAFTHYLGEEKSRWCEYDTVELIQRGASVPPMLIDQGTADEFLEEQLKTDLLLDVIREKKLEDTIEVRMQQGYDHSYYFIASFIRDHIAFHSRHLS